MPTYNEQKGQGLFQPVLSEAGGSVGDSGPTVPGGAVAGAANAVSGVADVLSILAQRPLDPEHDSEELVANKADLESLLTGELSLIAGQEISGGIVPGSKDEIAKVAAGYQQGRIGRDEMNVRLASIVQRYVSADPRNAKEYREIARLALGYQPSAQIAADELADLQFEKDQQRQIARDDADYARQQYGYVEFDDTGAVDVEATARKGRMLRAQDGELRRLKEKADLLKVKAETQKASRLTEAEIDRAEFRALSDTVTPLIDTHLYAAYQATSALNSGNFAQLNEDEWRATTTAELQQRRQAVVQLVNDAAINGRIGNTARKEYLDTATNTFDEAISIITGDRSAFTANKAILDNMKVQDEVEFREAAPFITKANQALGSQTTANIVNGIVNSDQYLNGGVKTTLAQEVGRVLGNTSDIVTTNKEIADLSREDRPATAQGLLKTIDTINKRPQRATEEEQASYLVANAKLINAANDVSSISDRSKAAQRLSTESNLAALEAYAANNNNARIVAEQLRNLNTQAFQESARRIEPGTTANQLVSFIATRGVRQPQQFFPVYNPETGRIEIYSGTSVDNLSPATERVPPFMETEVNKMNRNINTVVRLKNYGEQSIANSKDEDIRMLLAQTAGLVILGQEKTIEE